jgi:hypothetical protein
MSLEADSREQASPDRTGHDEDANADAPTKSVNESPFSTSETAAQFRSFLLTASDTPFDEQDEPQTPSEPPADDSPFSTPEVEEITKGAPPTPDDGD